MTARWPAAVRALLLMAPLCLQGTLAAAFTARLDVRGEGQTISGQVNCIPGGEVAGEALLALTTDAQTGPLLQGGGRAAGRYELRLVFKGSARAGAPESLVGTADLSGLFTFRDGRSALVMGSGEFTGRGSVGSGLVRLEAPWRVSCMGGGLVSPQELTLSLPPFTLQQPEATAAPALPAAVPAAAAPATVPGAAVEATPPATAPATPAPLPAVASPATLPTGLSTGLPTAPLATPLPAGVPVAAGGVLDLPLLNVLLGPQQTENGRCVQPAAVLTSQTRAVYAYVELKSALPGGQLLVTLYHGPKVKEKHLIAAAAGDRFIITFYPTNTPFLPEGAWSLQLQAGGRDLGCVPFSVGQP